MLSDHDYFETILKAAFSSVSGITVYRNKESVFNYLYLKHEDGQYIGRCQIIAGEKGVNIFDVNINFPKKGIGRKITKAAALWAEALGKTSMTAVHVNEEGLMAWPRLGALPSADALERLSLACVSVSNYVAQNEREKLKTINLMAHDDNKSAWYAMTDKSNPSLYLDTNTLQFIGLELYNYQDLTFDIMHPSVRQRLGLDL